MYWRPVPGRGAPAADFFIVFFPRLVYNKKEYRIKLGGGIVLNQVELAAFYQDAAGWEGKEVTIAE